MHKTRLNVAGERFQLCKMVRSSILRCFEVSHRGENARLDNFMKSAHPFYGHQLWTFKAGLNRVLLVPAGNGVSPWTTIIRLPSWIPHLAIVRISDGTRQIWRMLLEPCVCDSHSLGYCNIA